jgi:hypothetical protein
MNTDIVIVVKGGLVVSVYARNEQTTAEVVDLDNDPARAKEIDALEACHPREYHAI